MFKYGRSVVTEQAETDLFAFGISVNVKPAP